MYLHAWVRAYLWLKMPGSSKMQKVQKKWKFPGRLSESASDRVQMQTLVHLPVCEALFTPRIDGRRYTATRREYVGSTLYCNAFSCTVCTYTAVRGLCAQHVFFQEGSREVASRVLYVCVHTFIFLGEVCAALDSRASGIRPLQY